MNVTTATTTQYISLSPGDILTEEEQNELIMWRSVFNGGQFRIGDVAANKIEQYARSGIVIPDAKIDYSVGVFCGKTARTVRYYRETAVFYSLEDRQKYEILPFSHFVFARSMGDRWREVLEYAMLTPNMTEDVLKELFIKDVAVASSFPHEPPEEEGGDPDYNPLTRPPIEMREVSHDKPGYARHVKLGVINAFASSLGKVIDLVAESKMEDRRKQIVLDALSVLRDNMPDVLKELANVV